MAGCTQCPRECGADRSEGEKGFCGVGDRFAVAYHSLHRWEEPPISGTNGSGAIFFCGCNLQCVFCQNKAISRGDTLGKTYSEEELLRLMLDLQGAGAHNINLVTPTHYALQLVPVLQRAKPQLHIPVVYNCGGYEKTDTLRALDGLVDIYLPDFKYFDGEIARKYSGAEDYYEVALSALQEMLRQVGPPVYGKDRLLKKGVIVRHLVLPSHRQDSIALLQKWKERFGSDRFLLSLMSQYTPEFAADAPFRNLHRRLTAFEYDSVLNEAMRLGFDGFFQSRSSATPDYTPHFEEGAEELPQRQPTNPF